MILSPSSLIRVSRIAATLACFAIVACAPGTERESAVPDALGVIESTAPLWSSSTNWIVSEEPETVIGNDTGPAPYLLYGVQTAILLPTGGVVVASRGTRDLRYFTEDGIHQRTVGGHGQGPGEFEWPRWMGITGNGDILVWDGPNSRVHVFDAIGELLRTTAIDPTIPPSMSGNEELPGRPAVVGAFADASLVVVPAFPTSYLTSRSDGTYHLTTSLVRYGADGSAEAHLADVAGDEHAVHGGSSMHLPFGHRLYVAVGHGRIYVGSGKPYEIAILDRTGTEMGRIRRGFDARAVSAADRQRHRELFLQRVSASSRRAAELELDAMQFPAEFPTYDALLVDSEGNLWSRNFEWPRDGESEWSVFDTSGAWLGTVKTPTDIEVADIDDSRLVGITQDEAGVERVVIHKLVKPR